MIPDDIVFIDTETTGLLKAEECDLHFQPRITEIGIIRTNWELRELDTFHAMLNPGVPITEEITKITGITNEMVAGKPKFVEVYNSIVDTFIGARYVVAHNCTFDMGMIWAELKRCDLEFKFPWPPVWICTVEKSMQIEHRRLSLKRLHEIAYGSEPVISHRALDDVNTLIKCFTWMRENSLV